MAGRATALGTVLSVVAIAAATAQEVDGPRECRGKRATIVGTPGDDRLVGTPQRDVIVTGAGDNVVLGRGGDDLVCGHGGSDVIYGGAGDDVIGGGDGTDRLIGGPGDDRLLGKRGDDRLNGGPGADRLYGHRGRDRIVDGPGADILSGGAGDDECRPGSGRNVLASSCDLTLPTGPDAVVVPRMIDGGGVEIRLPPPPPNAVPLAADDHATVSETEGATIDVLANDSDPDGDPLRVLSVGTAQGTVSIPPDGSGVVYDPDGAFDALQPGETGTDTFDYVVDDGQGGSAGATVVVTIEGGNTPPAAGT